MTAGPRLRHVRAYPARIRAALGGWCEQTLVRTVLSLGRSPWGSAGHGRARGVLHVFLLGERIMQRRHPLRAVQPGGFMRYEIGPLPRSSGCLPLPSQPPVRAGERVLILHFDNPAVVGLAASGPRRSGPSWRILRNGRTEMEALANLARQGSFPPDVRAMWAETIFAPGIARLGFRARHTPPDVRATFVRLFLLGLIAIYGDGPPQLQERRLRHMRLGEVWMGLDELQQRFGTRALDSDDAAAEEGVSERQGQQGVEKGA